MMPKEKAMRLDGKHVERTRSEKEGPKKISIQMVLQAYEVPNYTIEEMRAILRTDGQDRRINFPTH